MACCLLDVAERDAGVEGGGDEPVAQGVWSDLVVDPGRLADATHDPCCGVTVERPASVRSQNRAFVAFADDEIDRPGGPWGEWHDDSLAALAEHREGALTGVVMMAISVSGWSTNRSGRTPWGLLAAWPITLVALMGLLAVVQ